MEVPLVDLGAAFAPVREPFFRELESILTGMQLLLGPNVEAFEAEFAAYCEVAHGVAVSSGTDALFAALAACEIGPGDEVIVPALTFFATLEAVIHVGATPVIVDVSPETLTIDPERVRGAVGPATRALIPVHLYGQPADMDPLLAIAREHGLRVIEDVAQAHGARDAGRRCGSMGDLGCFSFYYTKNLGALGEAGFVTTGDASLAERLRLLRHHGHTSKFEHRIVGYNLRMDEVQAAVLRAKLPGLDAGNARRRALAAQYDRRFAEGGLRRVAGRAGSEPVHHLYPLRVRHRDALIDYLQTSGVGTGIHYKIPVHRQPALATHRHRALSAPVSERACGELVSIPIYPELSDEQLGYVADRVLEFLDSNR